MENSNCCSPNQDKSTNCCSSTKTAKEPKADFKKGLGLLILGLAFVFAISSVFKTATNANELAVTAPSIEDFQWMETDKEAAYVLLKGNDEAQNKQMSTQITEVLAELNESDGSAQYYELAPSDEQYTTFSEAIGIENSPAVVVIGRAGALSLFDSETMSSIKLYKAYVAATTAAATCNPAACATSKSCKPSKSCTPAQKAKCAGKK